MMDFSLSKNRCGCKLKKYILIRSGHKKNIGFFALALTARVVRGSNSSFLLCRSYILNPSSLLVLYRLCLACFLQIAKCRANLKIVIFDNINTFRLNKDIKVKT